jgi:predicted nucleic acid-binding protein
MIVVSDTSPVTNLLIIGRLNLLRNIFGKVIIPVAVAAELYSIDEHRRKLENLDWIEIVELKDRSLLDSLTQTLDAGEAEAIALSIELSADVVLIDELEGRQEARRLGIEVTGLIGVLVEAKKLGLIDLVKAEIDNLVRDARFWLSARVISDALKAAGER